MSTDSISTDELTRGFILPLWNEKKVEVIDKYLSPSADIRTTFLVGKGLEAFKESVKDTFNAFPDLALTLEEIVQQENRVTYKWSASAEHKGTILNIKPTGKKLFFHGIVFGEINQGLITQYHSFTNIPQVLYSNIEQSLFVTNAFPSHAVLLNHENYDKEISDLLFSIAKKTGARLTRREVECLNFWVKGYSIKETARQLGGLSVKTIQVFRDSIRKKFEVTSYRNLLDLMRKTGILPLFVGA